MTKPISPFTLPEEVFGFVPSKTDILVRFSNGEFERKIFGNCELSLAESAKLYEFWAYVKEGINRTENYAEAKLHGSKEINVLKCKISNFFCPLVISCFSRLLDKAKNNMSKAYRLALESENFFALHDKDICRNNGFSDAADSPYFDLINSGVFYFCGRDSSLRPLLVFRYDRSSGRIGEACSIWKMERQIDVYKAIVFTCQHCVKYALVPGVVESICVLMDC